jgi:spermidine synthase
MREWETVDYEAVPEDDGTIILMCRGSEWRIAVDDRELMTNRMHGSEKALSDLACDRLERLDDARILVGGLGMGFTLRAALDRVGEKGLVMVAELMPAVIRWNRDYDVGRASRFPLRDPRCRVHEGDVAEPMVNERWSAILLDVDNGPQAVTRHTNNWLYSREALRKVRAALIPGGILGVWSVLDDKPFTRRLKEEGFEVEVIRFVEDDRPTPDDSGAHYLWMARSPVAATEPAAG